MLPGEKNLPIPSGTLGTVGANAFTDIDATHVSPGNGLRPGFDPRMNDFPYALTLGPGMITNPRVVDYLARHGVEVFDGRREPRELYDGTLRRFAAGPLDAICDTGGELIEAATLAGTSVAGALESWRRRGMESVGRRALRLEALAQNLAHLDPRAVLTRGYAIVARADGTIVRDSAEVEPEDVVQLTFARGTADAAITRRD